jgi:hypothetical protein
MKKLEFTRDYVDFCLEKLRSGEFELAFHALCDVGHSVVPILIDVFRLETRSDIRAELVGIIWNYRRPETVGFLGEALADSDPKVWRNALDGLVALASPAALQILQAALSRELPSEKQTEEFRQWVSEAITQAQEAIATSG